MTIRISLLVIACLACSCVTTDRAADGGGAPIADVKREVYQEHPEEACAIMVWASYVDAGLTREEVHSFERISDEPEKPKRRMSKDNGRTWSDFEALPDMVLEIEDHKVFWAPSPKFYDAEHDLTVAIWLRQPYKGNVYYNQCFSRVSKDLGRTWSAPKQIRYEDGPAFDPEDSLNPEFLTRNQGYFGNNIIRHSNGTLIHCLAAVNVPYENKTGKSYHQWTPADSKSIGSLCAIGTWDDKAKDYAWTAGAPVWVPLEVSSRGLMEPDVVELKDGRVLVVWRASDTPVTEGHKWFSLSEDGGKTLTPVAEWKYEDGMPFYSPSSIHRFIRHSQTGTLYWVGNICPAPPSGNSPRYPLIIAEVDEERAALKRNTVTAIDVRGPDDTAAVQLSNFSLFENRETHDFELYLTKYGQYSAKVWQTADCYKYVVTLR
jgi:hypothetical protein